MELLIQLIAAMGILGCGYLAMKLRPKKIETATLVLVTLLVCAAIVLQYFSIMIPLFGANSFKISFEQLPIIFVGALFGPFWGFLGAVIADTLSFLINPQGTYFIGFLLSRILVAMIPSLWFSHRINFQSKTMLRGSQIAITILFAGACIYVALTPSITISKEIYPLDFATKVGMVLLGLALSSFLVAMIEWIAKRTEPETSDFVGRFTLSVIMIELLVQMLLTPMWLQVMYHIPYLLNLFVRVLSGSLMVPLKIFIGISLQRIVFSKMMKKVKKETLDQ